MVEDSDEEKSDGEAIEGETTDEDNDAELGMWSIDFVSFHSSTNWLVN